MTRIICGLDISSKHLDARVGRDGAQLRVERTPAGILELAAFCRHHQVELVAMEATGGYEQEPFALLWAQGIGCAIANPRSVRRFAEAMGVLEKADHIDTGMIAWYAQVKNFQPQQPATASQNELRALALRMRQLVELRVCQQNQRRLIEDPTVLAGMEEMMALLGRQLRSLSEKLAKLLADDPLWRACRESFITIKGVADKTVVRVLALLPEIGTISGKAAAKLAGLAPIIKESGKYRGKRKVRGGREGLRSILFVIAKCAAMYEPDLRAFRDKLLKAGKCKKAVRVALARKILVRLNAKARDVRKALAEKTPQRAPAIAA